MFNYTPVSADKLIAGRHFGKRITITPQAEPIWNELVGLANRGNYWAQMSVNGIKQLAAGRLSQKNIFVKPGCTHRGGTEEFVIILPGCRVTAEKLSNDSYKLLHFQADLSYGDLIEERLAPGLYGATFNEGRWSANLRKNGEVDKRPQRVIAIGDSGYSLPGDAVKSAADTLSGSGSIANVSGGARSIKFAGPGGGFDLHFTPGSKPIGGLVRYRSAINPLGNERLYESALLLARTMYMAKDVQDVRWISEFGGSGVLTQALQILADRKVKLNGHTAFMYRPSTSPNEALKAMHGVEGLELDRKVKDSNALDYIGNRDNLRMIRERRRKEEDTYTLLHKATDTVCAGVTVHNAVGFVAGAAGLAGLAVSAPAAGSFLAALGAAAGVAGAAGKLGLQALKAWAPRKYNEVASKL
ncbi:hypothetical protein [Microbulbifer sp. MCCC 1A16149]|uniref:hypothetical protein n=1 Tax=Microbulbifer sp. MCCC 1A16149 TaxID=3411322 RepID=UPI003D13DC81